MQSAGSPAQGLPVSGSKQRRCRYCSEASRVTEVGGRPDVFRRQCPSRAVFEAGARALWGRQGPQGDHSDHSVRGRRPRWAKGLCWSRGVFSSESPVGRQEELRVMIGRGSKWERLRKVTGRAGYYLSRTVLALAKQVPCPEAPQRWANRDSSLKVVITFTPLAGALQLSTQAFTVGRSTPGWALGVGTAMHGSTAQGLGGLASWALGVT